MTTDRAPLFCDTALAERIERAETQLIAAWNDATRRRLGDRPSFPQMIGGAAILGGLVLLLRSPAGPPAPSTHQPELVEEYR